MKNPKATEYTSQKIPMRPISKTPRDMASASISLSLRLPEALSESPEQTPPPLKHESAPLTIPAVTLPEPTNPPPLKPTFAFQENKSTSPQKQHRYFLKFAILFVAAFVAGFFLKLLPALIQISTKASLPIIHEPQEKALHLLDDLMQAKYENRLEDAKAGAKAARLASPDIPGVEIALAELALLEQKPEEVKIAAREALQRGQTLSEAKLLLALEKWMMRGTGSQAAEAVAAAKQLMQEASEDDLSNMTIMFFRGDMEHYTGDKSKAHALLLGALYRQQIWLSHSILAAKMQLAAQESADGLGAATVPSSPFGEAWVALQQALRSNADLQPSLNALQRVTTAWQIKYLLNDQAFEIDTLPPILRKAKMEPIHPLPGSMAQP